MKKISHLFATASVFALPFVAAAQVLPTTAGTSTFVKLLQNILAFANGVLVPFIIGIGFLVFVWGMFQYFIAGGSNDEAKEKGKSLMIYATLGFVLIVVFWGIINLLTGSTGLDKGNGDINPGGVIIK